MAVNLIGLTASTFIVSYLAGYLGSLTAKTVSIPIIFVWNYSLSRLVVFRVAGAQSRAEASVGPSA